MWHGNLRFLNGSAETMRILVVTCLMSLGFLYSFTRLYYFSKLNVFDSFKFFRKSVIEERNFVLGDGVNKFSLVDH